MRSKILSASFCVLLASACGSETDDISMDEFAQCTGGGYTAFDQANHANQDLRVGAYVQMVDLMNQAKADPAQAEALFTQAEDLYINTASLQAKVQGRKDDHLSSQPAVGVQLDETIMAGFASGKLATTTFEVNLAKQAVDKTMIEFFFLSVYHELQAGSRAHWDEAFGYYGSGANNDDARGFAKLADKRDATNGTNLRAEIFNAVVDGSCELAKALDETGTDEIDNNNHPSVLVAIDAIDSRMQVALAYSVGHEAYEMDELLQGAAGDLTEEDQEAVWIKLVELEHYFRPLERIMQAAGGESATRAQSIRTILDQTSMSATDWMPGFDASIIIDLLEAEFSGIEIRG